MCWVLEIGLFDALVMPSCDVPVPFAVCLVLCNQPGGYQLGYERLDLQSSKVVRRENFGLKRPVCRWVISGVVAEVPHTNEQ